MWNQLKTRFFQGTLERKGSGKAPRLKQSIWDDHVPISRYDPLQLFRSNVVVYRCISLIARSIGSIRWFLEDETGPLTEHKHDYLLHAPNPMQTQQSFLENIATNLLLFGTAYIYRTVKDYQSWQVLKTEHVTIKHAANGVPVGYVYQNGNQKLEVPIDSSGKSDILQIQLTNSNLSYQGMSPCSVIAKVVEFYNHVTEHNISLLKKGGRPSGVLRVKSDGLTPEQLREIEQQIRKWNVGPRNAGDILVLTTECEWKEMGLKPLDTNFLEGQHTAARQIAQVFGVPPMLIGIQGDATFANYKEARVHFWEDTVLPLMQKICSCLSIWLSDEDNVRLAADTYSIEALEPKQNERWKHVEEASFLSQEEKRAYLGFPAKSQKEAGGCDV